MSKQRKHVEHDEDAHFVKPIEKPEPKKAAKPVAPCNCTHTDKMNGYCKHGG